MANFTDDSDSENFVEMDNFVNDADDGDDSDFSLYLSTSDESDSEETDEAPVRTSDSHWVTGENVVPSPKVDFTGPVPGPTVTIDKEFRELDFMTLFFTDDIMEILVTQTNAYADRIQERDGPDKNWTPVTEEEMTAWLGIRVIMSVQHFPTIDMYWSEDSLYGGHKLALIMQRDRYNKISQYLHVADDSTNVPRGHPGHDRLHKVREVLEIVRSNCLKNYNPHQNTSVDEAMIAFRGRLGFKQYLPAKPTKYGVKVWMRADPTNGYVNDFQVYTGKENGTSEVGLGARVVMDLISPLRNLHHIVNCDNFFMSPELCRRLLDAGTYARGTVRTNRKDFPKTILHSKCVKSQGDLVCAQKGDIVAVAWKDKKIVNLLSTADDPAHIKDTIARKQRDGSVTQVSCPTVVKQYNSYMNGVDRADQIRTELSTYRTSKKWWHYLFWFLFDVAICNGFVMMRESASHEQRTKSDKVKARTMLQFRMALGKQLVGQYQGIRKRKRVSNVDPSGSAHWPTTTEKRGRCRQCSKMGKRREVKVRCSACDIGLCVDCFEPYHTALFQGL